MLRKSAFLAVLIITLLNPIAKADDYIKREFRAIWLTTVWAIDWPSTTGTTSSAQTAQKNQMIAYLDQLEQENFNAVCFQVRSMCDAMYNSKYEPWSSYLTGSRGSNPGWDPLAFVVEECHKRGMECHAWVNPFRFSTGTAWNTTQDQQLKNNGWLLSYSYYDESVKATKTTTILNPGIPEARKRIVDVCQDIITNYDVDGIIFDDYFYPNGIPTTSAAEDYSLWQSSGSGMTFANWRRNNINIAISDIYAMIQSVKPWVRFGIGPAGAACSDSSVAASHGVEPLSNYCSASDWQYNGIFSDPVQWLEDGTIDYISPQIYWTTTNATNPFGPMTQWWSKVANQFGRHHFASHSLSFLKSNTESNWQDVGKQLQYSRDYTENAAPGSVFYSFQYMSGKTASGFGDWLLANKYQMKSLPPAMTWKTATDPGKVKNLSSAPDSNGGLFWDNIGTNYRYSVYAIPSSVSKSNIMSTVVDGIESKYLVDITYNNYIYLPEEKVSGYYYAVCALDRFGNEYAPCYSNENVLPADKVTLTAPINGASVKSPAKFSWTAATGATYRLQISKSSSMSSLVIDQSGITTNSTTVDLSSLGESQTCYWRVVCSQSGKEDTPSDVATFKTAEYESISGLSLSSPANGSTVADQSTITFAWAGVAGASYSLEIATNSSFSDIVASKSTTSTSASIAMSSLQYNSTYYWRITATKSGYKTTSTSAWSFSTPRRDPAPAVTLIAPTNGSTLNDAFSFVFTAANVDSYTLQIATNSSFSNVVKTITSGFTANGSNMEYAVAKTELPRGSYYWRVVTTKAGCLDSSSDTWQFVFDVSGEAGYFIKKDLAAYDPNGEILLENLWMRSIDSNFNNLPTATDWGLNRGMCAIDNIIYICGRVANAQTTDCYIDRYNAFTGEHMSRLELPTTIQDALYPCNSIMKDNAGNLLISNLTNDLSTRPLVIHKIDKLTGEATKVASLTYTGGGRVDHCSIYGNISDTYYVFAALSGGKYVIRWTVTNGAATSTKAQSVRSFYPSTSNFGISVRTFPVSSSECYVNSSAIHPTRYKIGSSKLADSFSNNTSARPVSTYANGLTMFTFLGTNYFVYPNNPVWMDDEGEYFGGPNDFVIASTTSFSSSTIKNLSKIWTVPEGGLGNAYSSYADAIIDNEPVYDLDRNIVAHNIYFYIPSSGFAAYQIRHSTSSGSVALTNDSWTAYFSRGYICTSREADINVVSLSGALAKSARSTTRLNIADLPKGIYIATCASGGSVKTFKVIK